MSATVLPFRGADQRRNRAAANLGPVIENQWAEGHLPVIRLGLELLETDDADFARRCRAMMTGDGASLIAELCETLQRTGAALDLASDVVKLTRTRLQVAVAEIRRV